MSLLPPVLLIDDSSSHRALVSLVVKGAFGEAAIDEAADAAALTRALIRGGYGVVLCECSLPWINGAELVSLVRERVPEAAVVAMYGPEASAVPTEVLQRGIDGVLSKDATGLAGVEEVLRAALHNARKRCEGGGPKSRQLIDGLPVGIFVADADGVMLDVNPTMADLLGFEQPQQLISRHFHHFLVGEAAAQNFSAAVHGEPSVIDLEAELERRDGARVWAHINLWPAPPSEGVPSRFHGLVEDIGSYRHALSELEGRSAELERSNRDLEEMAYVVSHDLQQPLGVISRSLDLLNEELGSTIKGQPREYLSHAQRGSEALERMLTAIVGYSRVDTRGDEFSDVDLQRVVDGVLDLLEEQLAATAAKVSVDPLPTVWADEAQMEQLFQNLLSNAIKFHGSTPPQIHVSASEQRGRWQVSVRDQGIGIDASAIDRIFLMFQRLHTEEEIPGTGIGLAVCRRIIIRHGGKIWVDSRPGEGSTFHFTLPRAGETLE